MIAREKIKGLCSKVIDDVIITTKVLNDCDFISQEIDDLVSNGIIRRVNSDEYELVSVETLYEYGLEQWKLKNYDIAKLCFEKCLELDRNHRGACLQVFFDSIRLKNYNRAFDLLDVLFDIDDDNLVKEDNLYLYLLNFLVPCPDRYVDKVRALTRDDLTFGDCDEIDEKAVVDRIFEGKTRMAMRLICNLSELDSVKKVIVRELLFSHSKYEEELPKKVFEYVEQERYNDIEILLRAKSKTHRFSPEEKFILKLCEDIKKIIRTREIPPTKVVDTDDMFEAIRGNDFELAKSLCDGCDNINEGYYKSLSILLDKVIECITIASIKELKSYIHQGHNQEVKIDDLRLLLENGKVEVFFGAMKNYLKQINREKFEYLLIELIKISLLENDKTFYRVFATLEHLAWDDYRFLSSIYIQEFYSYICQNKLKEAEVCLAIISRYGHDSQNIIIELTGVLERAKNAEMSEEECDRESVSKLVLNIVTQMRRQNEIVHLLQDVSDNKRNLICSLINEEEEFRDIRVWSIGSDPKTVLFRLVDLNSDKLNICQLVDNAFLCHRNRQYNQCIEMIELLLRCPDYDPSLLLDPRPIFDILGDSYLRVVISKNTARKYFIIVTKLNECMANGEQRYDHTELIAKLSVVISCRKREVRARTRKRKPELKD
jgi:hypothetical protein